MGAGHDSREFMAEEYRDLFQAFFCDERDPHPERDAGISREIVRIELPPIRFVRPGSRKLGQGLKSGRVPRN